MPHTVAQESMLKQKFLTCPGRSLQLIDTIAIAAAVVLIDALENGER